MFFIHGPQKSDHKINLLGEFSFLKKHFKDYYFSYFAPHVMEIEELLFAALWSFSPFGEAKVGIPYGILSGAGHYMTFIVCFLANVLIFPMMLFFLNFVNSHFLKWRLYKRSAIFVARRAKTGAGKTVQRFGFWGLLIFVMMPIPGTGVYAGTIAGFILGIEKKRAFMANTIGIFFSCVIVWSVTVLAIGK